MLVKVGEVFSFSFDFEFIRSSFSFFFKFPAIKEIDISTIATLIGVVTAIVGVKITYKTWQEMLRQRDESNRIREEEIKINRFKLKTKYYENLFNEVLKIQRFDERPSQHLRKSKELIQGLTSFYKPQKVSKEKIFPILEEKFSYYEYGILFREFAQDRIFEFINFCKELDFFYQEELLDNIRYSIVFEKAKEIHENNYINSTKFDKKILKSITDHVDRYYKILNKKIKQDENLIISELEKIKKLFNEWCKYNRRKINIENKKFSKILKNRKEIDSFFKKVEKNKT